MKINRGNRDVVQDVQSVQNIQNVQDVNTKDVTVEVAKAPVQEEAKEEAKEKFLVETKKTDTIVKIQEARRALAEKKAIEEKLQRQDEEAAELQSLLEDMKAGTVKSEKVIKKVRSTIPKTEKAKRAGGAPSGHKLPTKEEEKTDTLTIIESKEAKEFREKLNKIRREIAVDDIQKGMTAFMRHKNRVDITALYEPLPDDEEIETEFGFNIKITPKITYNEIMSCIQWIFHFAVDGREFISEPVLNISIDMGIINAYTNLNIIEEKLLDQYDILKRSGYLEIIKDKIDKEQVQWIEQAVRKSADNCINYQNSARGILMAVSDMALDENNGFNKILKNFSENEELLKQIEPVLKAYQDLK